jgi:Anti-sigma-28 factor, FlgM
VCERELTLRDLLEDVVGRRRIDHEAEMVYSHLGDKLVLESRASRVQRLQGCVKAGTYRIDTHEIASSILNRSLVETERKPRTKTSSTRQAS